MKNICEQLRQKSTLMALIALPLGLEFRNKKLKKEIQT